jgi:hypothetical protein
VDYSNACDVYDDKFKCTKCKFSEVKVLVYSKFLNKYFPSNSADEFCALYNNDFKCVSCTDGYGISLG